MKHLTLSILLVLFAFQVNAQKSKKGRKSAAKTTTQKSANTPEIIYENAEIKFDSLSHDFKDVLEGMDAIHVFTFYNIGKEPLVLSDARPSCSCTVSDYTKEPIMPGKSGMINVKYATHGRMGAFTKSVTVTSNSTLLKIVTLTISGNVIAAPQEVH